MLGMQLERESFHECSSWGLMKSRNIVTPIVFVQCSPIIVFATANVIMKIMLAFYVRGNSTMRKNLCRKL